jgi:hypothetical protein
METCAIAIESYWIINPAAGCARAGPTKRNKTKCAIISGSSESSVGRAFFFPIGTRTYGTQSIEPIVERAGDPSWRSFAGSAASDHFPTKTFLRARVVRSSISGKTTKRHVLGELGARVLDSFVF